MQTDLSHTKLSSSPESSGINQHHQQQIQLESDPSNNTQQIMPMNSSIVPECSGCLCQIQERYYLLVMDKAWHLNCLRCFECKQSLDSQQSCFTKDGVIYCKEDYFK